MAQSAAESTRVTDGTLDFSGGVDSDAVPTIQSELNPNGLQRNQLAWLNNANTRNAGIMQRTGWKPVCKVHEGGALYQGGWMYSPLNGFPYLVVSIGGTLLRVDIDVVGISDLSATFGLSNPATETYGYFCQGEEFLVIQAGDGVTLPLFWDGVALRRSVGLNPGAYEQAELPAAYAMDYFMGRLWYSQGRNYSAGDIVKGAYGTSAYNYRDSILKVTENPLAVGGDGFTVPSNAGNIRSLFHLTDMDETLGVGQLYVGTRKAIYSLTVPVTRTAWIAADNANMPVQRVVLRGNGTVNDRSVAIANGDAFFQSIEPSIRSLVIGRRDMQQWGNTPISCEENRILAFNDRGLMRFGSGVLFDNRVLQTALPKQTTAGVVSQAIIPLDFQPVSKFNKERPPVWEGMYEGLDIFQMFTGDFGGRERLFAMVLSRADESIWLWELTDGERFENGDNRVTWVIESPAFTWGHEFALKQLESAELWYDKIWGTVDFEAQYRVDQDPCWRPWHRWRECVARSSAEDEPSVTYPETPYREGFRATKMLPQPQLSNVPSSGRPASIGYQFQLRLVIKGWCRIRGLLLHATLRGKAPFDGMNCVEPIQKL